MSTAPDSLDDTTTPVPTARLGPRLYGVVDVIRPDRIAGWAIDRADSQAALEIDVCREGRLVATVRADRFRKDLERGSVGTGRYGFACELTPPLEPGFEFTVSVSARTPDGVSCELKRVGLIGMADPDRRLVERIFESVTRLPVEPPKGSEVLQDLQDLPEVIRRLEVAQARIERMLDAVEPPPPPSLGGLKLILAISLAIGIGSLALGVFSMWPS